MSPTPIQMRRPRLSVKLSLLVYTAEAPLHSCRTVGKDRTSRLPGLGHHALLSPIKKSGCRLRAPAAKPCTPDHKLPSGTAAGVGGGGGGAELYLRGARSAPASSRGGAGPAWGRCSAGTRPLPTAPAPLWRLLPTWRGWSL